MRAVDMSLHRVVKCGVSWPFSFQPNSKNMIVQLERNEALVTWLEPLDSDDISKQFPAIRVRDQYYTMSLRMMKVSAPGPTHAFSVVFTTNMSKGSLEAHPTKEELRQPRDDPARGRQASHPGSAARREDAHAAAVQCE